MTDMSTDTPPSLYAVDAQTPPLLSVNPRLPDFEGQTVDDTRVKLSSVSSLEAGESWSRIDDTVRMYVEGRVTRVDHVVDERTGHLLRVHTVKVVDAVQLPWDFDTGQLD